MNENTAARKIQLAFRKKRLFTNTVNKEWKLSASTVLTSIVSFKLPINLDDIILQESPKGVSEIMGYKNKLKKPTYRWIKGGEWLGDLKGITRVVAKKDKISIVLTKDGIDVMGAGNYEQALLTCVKNEWAPKSLLKMRPVYRKVDGVFYINKPFDLDGLNAELKKLPTEYVSEVRYLPEIGGIPAVVLKLKVPKWTYQFFKNGTVLFTGISDPSAIEEPKKLFKQFFTKYNLSVPHAIATEYSPAKKKPGKTTTNKKKELAKRYKLAGTWENLKTPPYGYYIRPGSNGKPRFYAWRTIEKVASNIGEGMPHITTYNRGPKNLSGVAPKVKKAFKNIGQPIPQSTLNAFRQAGYPLNVPSPETKKTVAKHSERRAPSWNAVKPGFYVRPGPGQQPYWFAIPKGIESGRKTVIASYTKAGINIPKSVRNIFKIGNKVTTAGLKEHVVKMGLNKVLRINNRQATRFTKAELLQIARNMNIPQVNAKMKPAQIISYIQMKAGANKPNRNFNVMVNDVFYKFLPNSRVEKTRKNGTRTARAWSTLPAEEQNAIAKKLLPTNLHSEYETLPKGNKFGALFGWANQKKAAPPPAPSPPPPSSASSSGSSLGNFEKELEFGVRLQANLGNSYNVANSSNFMKIYSALPKGKRGAPLKATVNQAYKKFVKETKHIRKTEPRRVKYIAKIKVPNWMPTNKIQLYKNFVANLAFLKKTKKNIRDQVKSWINREVPQSPPKAAHDVEDAVTGIVTHVPAYEPKPRKTPSIPKLTPSPKKTKEPEVKKSVPKNLENAVANIGLNIKAKYTWKELQKAGLNKKLKTKWLKHT